MKHLESSLQISCVNWFRLQYHQYLLFAIPNGGKRNKIVASILKKEGTVSVVTDLCLLFGNKNYYALFIEMKHGKGKQTETQKAFESYCLSNKYKYIVVNNFEDFKKEIESYLK